MKPVDDNIQKVESVSTIIVNIGTMVSWLITIITAFILAEQPQPISLPGIIQLNVSYKLIFLASIFLGYLQLLRKLWESKKKKGIEAGTSLGSYIYDSVIKLKRPFVLIGFLIIFNMLGVIVFTELLGSGMFLLFIGGFLALIIMISWKEFSQLVKGQYDDEYRKRWLKRIRNQLYEKGCIHTGDFANLPTNLYEINWAIKLYFNLYEFEQDLVFSQKHLERNLRKYEICEIRFKHVESRIMDE